MNFVVSDKYPLEFSLHQKYATSQLLLDLVWTHSVIISEIADQLMANLQGKVQFDKPLVTQACLMHDIGVYACNGFDWLPDQDKSDKEYIHHSLASAWILMNENFHPEVIMCGLTHTGVGISANDINKYGLKLPPDNYSPQSLIQQLVSYSAKFHSKSPGFKSIDQISEHLTKYGPEKLDVFNSWVKFFGIPILDDLKSKYETWHRNTTQEFKNLTVENTHTQILTSSGIH